MNTGTARGAETGRNVKIFHNLEYYAPLLVGFTRQISASTTN